MCVAFPGGEGLGMRKSLAFAICLGEVQNAECGGGR